MKLLAATNTGWHLLYEHQASECYSMDEAAVRDPAKEKPAVHKASARAVCEKCVSRHIRCPETSS